MTASASEGVHDALKQSSRLRVEMSMLQAKLQLSEEALNQEKKRNQSLTEELERTHTAVKESQKAAEESLLKVKAEEADRRAVLEEELRGVHVEVSNPYGSVYGPRSL